MLYIDIFRTLQNNLPSIMENEKQFVDLIQQKKNGY